MRRLGRVVLAAALGGAVVGLPAVASARLTNTASETNSFAAGTLGAPGTPTTIHPNVTGSGDGDVRLTWTDTLARAVTYLVQRAPVATPTTWTTVNGGGSGQGSATLCTGSVPGPVSCTYDDNAASSTSAPAYNASYVYQVVSKVGGWTQPSSGRLAESLPPASGSSETYLVPRDLNAISAASATSMWAVGANCTVDYYNGSTWTLQTVPTSACPSGTTLNGVDANGGLPMVVGANGVTFICTASCTTGTPTWSAKSTSGVGSPTLNAVSAQSGTAMWAVGANCTLLYYNGAWAQVAVSTTYCAAGTTLYGVAANGGKPVAAGAAGTLFTCTTNCLGSGTPTLTTNTPAALAGTTFYAVNMVSTSVWAVGSGGGIAVCTGTCTGTGAVWAAQTSGTTATLRGVYGNSTTLVDTVGDSGTVLECTVSCNKSTGYSWAAKSSNSTGTLTGVTVPSTTVSIAVGRVGVIVNDGGWAPMSSGVTATLNAVSATSTTSAWAVGASCTVLYFNGSAWTQQAVGTGICPAGTTLYDVDANGGAPMVVGANGVTFICTASCTTASPTWLAKATPGSPTLYAVAAQSTTSMWAVGPSCTVLYYNGTTWVAQTPSLAACPSGTTLYAVAANAGKPIFGGASSTLFTCTGTCTGTPSWTVNTPGVPAGTTFYGVASATNAWAVGSGGAVAVCTGTCTGTGAAWTTQSSGTTATLRGISASSTTLIDVVGDSGTILQCTTNCTKATGAWAAQTSNSTATLTGVYVASATQAVAVGSGGVVLGLGTGAFAPVLNTSIPVDVPTTYTLGSGDLTNVSTPDSVLYTGHGSWPTSALPTTCTSSTPAVRIVPSPTIPAGSWTVSKAVVTVVQQVDNVPSGGAAFQLLVSGDAGTSWTAYPITTPAAASTPVTATVDVTTTIGTTAALQSARLCLQGSSGSGPALTSFVDLVHLDVN